MYDHDGHVINKDTHIHLKPSKQSNLSSRPQLDDCQTRNEMCQTRKETCQTRKETGQTRKEMCQTRKETGQTRKETA